jgi:hypothetical protein
MEGPYKTKLIAKIRDMFPGCMILKNDPNYLQGIPDLTILYGGRWAVLEVKTKENYKPEPNQPYYVKKLNEMWFSSFIYPENEEEVLDALQHALRS